MVSSRLLMIWMPVPVLVEVAAEEVEGAVAVAEIGETMMVSVVVGRRPWGRAETVAAMVASRLRVVKNCMVGFLWGMIDNDRLDRKD
jgi:hypothetical protein